MHVHAMPRVAKAAPEDAVGIQEVFYRAWLVTYPNQQYGITLEDVEVFFKERNSKERLEHRRQQARNPPEGEHMLVAKEGLRVVGVCRVIRQPNKNELQAIYVLPECHGRGIGTTLWQKACELLDHTREITLWVAPYNHKARRFYAKLGFLHLGGGVVYNDRFIMPVSGEMIPQIEMILRPAL